MAGRFEGKVGVVTGGANGFGEAVAGRLIADGASVVLVDVNDKVREVATRVGGVGVVADVTKPEEVARYVKEAVDAFGHIDLFFNNAGIEGPRGSFGDLSIEDFDRVLNVNVRGVWLGLHEVMPVMERSGGGAIVNTSSQAGIKGARNFSPYITSKHAVVGIRSVRTGARGCTDQHPLQRDLPGTYRHRDAPQARHQRTGRVRREPGENGRHRARQGASGPQKRGSQCSQACCFPEEAAYMLRWHLPYRRRAERLSSRRRP